MKGGEERKKKKKKKIYLLKFIYEGVPPTLKVAKYIPFAVNEAAVMDTYAVRWILTIRYLSKHTLMKK